MSLKPSERDVTDGRERPMTAQRRIPSAEIAAAGYETGADAVGIARAEAVDEAAQEQYRAWLERGDHAAMEYMRENVETRNDPRRLLEGAKSVIVLAYSYYSDRPLSGDVAVARYARGGDYHTILRKRLKGLVGVLGERHGAKCRVTVDSAPMRERYWAERAGVGFVGRNSQLIVPSVGSYCFIATVITTAEIEPTPRLEGPGCGECMRCVEACPGGAIRGEMSAVDARRCVSYLTVEGRHLEGEPEWPEGVRRPTCLTFGCDVCQQVCPYNRAPRATSIERFEPSEAVSGLRAEMFERMSVEELHRYLAGSALRRALRQK